MHIYYSCYSVHPRHAKLTRSPDVTGDRDEREPGKGEVDVHGDDGMAPNVLSRRHMCCEWRLPSGLFRHLSAACDVIRSPGGRGPNVRTLMHHFNWRES